MGLREQLDNLKKSISNADEIAKKLTTKDRKKLKEGTFCGPNRSFPVPDCKHVATAKAYLGRSNFSESTKKKIAACINRKAKQLGCKVSKKAKADEEVDLAKSELFKSTKELVEKSLRSEEPLDLEFSEEECEECN